MLLFDAQDACFVLENISEKDTFSLHKSTKNVRDISDALSNEKWICTLSPIFIIEFGMGDIVVLTHNYFDTSQIAFIPNLPIWNEKWHEYKNEATENECRIFNKAYKLISKSW